MLAPAASPHKHRTHARAKRPAVARRDVPPEAGGRPGRAHNLPVAVQLPLGVQVVAVLGYVGIFVVLWLTFGGDHEASFMVAISTFFAGVFFTIPYLMDRIAQKHSGQTLPTLGEFLAGEFDTWTGRISGWEALIQVALVPVTLAFGAVAIGTIVILSR